MELQTSATERTCFSKKNLLLMKGDKNCTYTLLIFRSSKRLRTMGDNDTDAKKTITKTPSSILSLYSSFIPTFFFTIFYDQYINPINPELNPICYLLPLLVHHFLHVSRIRVTLLTFRLLMSYIYMEHPFLMFLDHTRRRSTVGGTPLDE